MRFDTQKSFGYPVLRDGSDDYLRGKFQPTIHLQHVERGDENVTVNCLFKVGIQELADLVAQGKASYALVIDCREAYYRECIKINEAEYSFSRPKSHFRGKVEIECYIIANTDISNFVCKHINSDFGGGPFSFAKYDVLAQRAPESYYTLNDKFKSLQSLILPEFDDNLRDGEWYFDIDRPDGRPRIVTSRQQWAIFKGASASNITKYVVINTVLVPIVAKMIEDLNDPEIGQQVQEYRWAVKIREGLQEKNLSLDKYKDDSFRLAQDFLGLPISKINPLLAGEE